MNILRKFLEHFPSHNIKDQVVCNNGYYFVGILPLLVGLVVVVCYCLLH